MGKKKKRIKKSGIVILVVVVALIITGFIVISNMIKEKNRLKEHEMMYLANDTNKVTLYDELNKEVDSIYRGNSVDVYKNVLLEDGKVKIVYKDKIYYVDNKNLVKDKKDIVKEKEKYVRTSIDLLTNYKQPYIETLSKKGDKLEIVGYSSLDNEGNVISYQVKTSDGHTGYIRSKYVVDTLEEANKNYDEEGLYKTHSSRKDKLGGGNGGSLDYYPVEKPKFSDNPMPEQVYALYLNGTKAVISNVDKYIEYAKTTKINAFVVDIKDSGVTGYASPLMKEISPTSYKYAQNSLEDYQKAIKKIKDNGFYVIGRITTFKDEYFIKDHKEYAINRNGGPYKDNAGNYWPTAFNRKVWEFNIGLAIEAVQKMGFNEIQFDYVRFPDRTQSIEKTLDYLNTYKETKAEAIQRFLLYATDVLHEFNVYVSADVFGESSWGYVTAYGQYWPAISNVVDAISAMPYTDHFGSNSSYWTNPYQTMKNWGKTAAERQKEIPTPAVARTWITAYNTPYWNPTVQYNGEKLTEQINGLYEAGLKGGYMTWNSGSNLEKYKLQKSAFTKEYK